MQLAAVSLMATFSLLLAPLAYAASLGISGALAENTLNGATISITLTDDTFLDDTLANANFTLNNGPSGLSVSSVTRTSPTTATLTFSFSGTDFDTDITNFNVTVAASELTGGAPLTSNNLTITAVVEASPALTVSGSLTETNLNGVVITMSLANDTFKDSTLDKANFTLNNAPTGTSISSVTYVNDTGATMTLSFNGTDFDTNITNFTITIGTTELTSNANLTSNSLTITAVVEATSSVAISGSLTETNVNGAVIPVTLSNETFKDITLDKANFVLNNAPTGTSISSVTYVNTTGATVTLAFNGTDFDTNVTNFSITINASELTGNVSLTSNNLTITAVVEGVDTTKPTISSAAMDSTKKIVTITFSENINKVGTLSDLKSKIRFASNGTDFSSLGSSDSVTDMNGSDTKLIITFNTALSGTSNKIRVLSGAVKDAATNENIELTTGSIGTGSDTTKPTIKSVTVDHTLTVVTIIFSEKIDRAASSVSTLKGKIKFASDGSNYSSLDSNDTVTDLDGKTDKLIITFDDEISGTKNKIKIEADAVEDLAENRNAELITSSFDAEDNENPYIKSISMDNSGTIVTITFNEDIDKTDTLSALKGKIELAENGTSFDDLATDDEVADLNGDGETIKITFDQELTGTKNKIRILSRAVEDDSGNENDELISGYISEGSGDLGISGTTVDNSNSKVTLTFNKNIDRVGSLSSLKDDILFASDGTHFDALSDDDEVTDIDGSGKNLIITFDSPISGDENKIRIVSGALEDSDGNENEQLTTAAFEEKNTDTTKPAIDDVEIDSTDKKVTIIFAENISKIGTLDDLKDNIRLAKDGTTFSKLSSDDEVSDVTGSGKNLMITFDSALTGNKNKIKILSGALEDSAGNENDELRTDALSGETSWEDIDHPFTDIQGHWAEEYIVQIYALDIVQGRSSTTYAPDANINRAELAKIALLAFGIDIPDAVDENPFSDVSKNAWFAPYVTAAKENGIVSGYTNGTFLPEKEVSRAEGLKILLEASGLEIGYGTIYFTDTPLDAWYQKYIAYAERHGIIQGYSDGSFRPNSPITRAEISKILMLIINLKADQ